MGSGQRLTPGLRDELITAELAEALASLTGERVDVTSLDKAEAIDMIRQVQSPLELLNMAATAPH